MIRATEIWAGKTDWNFYGKMRLSLIKRLGRSRKEYFWEDFHVLELG